MANIKVSELNTATSFNDEDYTMIVQSGENKKITRENIVAPLIEKNIMMAQNSGSITTGQNVYEKIPLELNTSVGTKLTLDTTNNGIKIGSGVSYVKVSGSVTFSERAGSSRHALLIYKNASVVGNAIARFDGNWETIVLNEMLVPVQENDIIYLYVRTQDASGAVTDASFLTVEVVE